MAIHYVGNKGREESLVLSEHHVRTLAVEEEEMLGGFFLKPFQSEEYHIFHHHTDVEMNEAFRFVRDMFRTSVIFMEGTQQLARHLFEQTVHPRINGGEFYVVWFDHVVFDGEEVEAIGIYKSERKSTFMHIQPHKERFELDLEQGIDLKKLDKGCIVFRTHEEEGYRVLIHDQMSKGEEARYWKDDFLGLAVASSSFALTKHYVNMCRSFVMDQLPREFEVDRATQIDLMNRSSGYLVENDQIDVKEFAHKVLEQDDIVEAFQEFKTSYSQEHNIEIEDQFERSKPAFQQAKKQFKSVLKLDKNFHLYIHGDRNLVEHGFDEERGMKFYKVFYNEERS